MTTAPDPRLIAAYREGLSLRDCAQRFGLAKTTVQFFFSRWGIARRPQREARKLAADREVLAMTYDKAARVLVDPPSYSSVRVTDAEGKLVRVISTKALQERARDAWRAGEKKRPPAPQFSRRRASEAYATVPARERKTPYHPLRGRGGTTLREEEW